jgi:hypothetical protein
MSDIPGMPQLPPGLIPTAALIPSLKLLLVCTVWGSALLPLLLLLFFFSTPKIRRKPIFLMNVASVTMGIVAGIMNMKLNVSTT